MRNQLLQVLRRHYSTPIINTKEVKNKFEVPNKLKKYDKPHYLRMYNCLPIRVKDFTKEKPIKNE